MSNIDGQPTNDQPAAEAGQLSSEQVVDTNASGIAAGVADPPAVVSQAEYEELARAAAALYQENQRYGKYKDRIDRFESDPEFDTLYQDTTQFYEDGKKRRQQTEEAPSWFKPYAEAIDEFRGDREQTVNQRRAAEQAELNKFYADQRGYAARLKAEHKLSDADVVELSAIADTLASQRGKRVGLEEAYRSVSRFSAGTLETPPPVLRGDAGIGGVPAPSPTNHRENMKTPEGRRSTILSYIKDNR